MSFELPDQGAAQHTFALGMPDGFSERRSCAASHKEKLPEWVVTNVLGLWALHNVRAVDKFSVALEPNEAE